MTMPSMNTDPARSLWRFFPLGIIGALGLVILVNFGMIWSALRTFPGAVDDHAFDTGNNYNAILDEAGREAALGWHLDVRADGTQLSIDLTDREGRPLSGANITAIARRPVGPDETTPVGFVPDGDRYVAREPLPARGQWNVEIAAIQVGRAYHLTRRVQLK